MKILKYIGLFLLVLILAFFANGIFNPSVSYTCETKVNQSKETMWGIMNDSSKAAQWITGFKRTELLSGTAGTVGAVSNIYIDNQGQESVIKETMKEVVPNQKVAMLFEVGFMDMDYEMNLKESGGKTTVQSITTVRGNGIFAKSLIPLMKGGMIKQEQTNLDKLKALAEK